MLPVNNYAASDNVSGVDNVSAVTMLNCGVIHFQAPVGEALETRGRMQSM